MAMGHDVNQPCSRFFSRVFICVLVIQCKVRRNHLSTKTRMYHTDDYGESVSVAYLGTKEHIVPIQRMCVGDSLTSTAGPPWYQGAHCSCIMCW